MLSYEKEVKSGFYSIPTDLFWAVMLNNAGAKAAQAT